MRFKILKTELKKKKIGSITSGTVHGKIHAILFENRFFLKLNA